MSHNLLWMPCDQDGTAFEIKLTQGYVGSCFSWGAGRWMWHILHDSDRQPGMYSGSGVGSAPKHKGFTTSEASAKEAVEREAKTMGILS